MIQGVAVLCSLWVIGVFFVDLPFWTIPHWTKTLLSLPPTLAGFGITFCQFYFAWKSWRSHYFNKTDFLVNEFLKALMGDLPYRKLMAKHRLRKLWLCRYAYCPPTTNLVSEGFPKELYFVTDRKIPRKDEHEAGRKFPVKDYWPRVVQFNMNDIHLTIERTATLNASKLAGVVAIRITVRNSLIDDTIEIMIDPTTENFNFMMTILSKWDENPNFSFIRSVTKENYYGHCFNIPTFFEKVNKGELDYVMVEVPFGRRVLVG